MKPSDPGAWRPALASSLFCVVAFFVGVLDHVGMVPCCLGLLLQFAVLPLLIAHIVTLPLAWRRTWRSTTFAILVCVAVVPATKLAAPYAHRARFRWYEPAYESVATGIRDGTHPEALGPHERSLGAWVRAERSLRGDHDANEGTPGAAEPIVLVHFLVVSHGFAGHVGYARAFGRAADDMLRRGRDFRVWRRSEPLGGGWFLVWD